MFNKMATKKLVALIVAMVFIFSVVAPAMASAQEPTMAMETQLEKTKEELYITYTNTTEKNVWVAAETASDFKKMHWEKDDGRVVAEKWNEWQELYPGDSLTLMLERKPRGVDRNNMAFYYHTAVYDMTKGDYIYRATRFNTKGDPTPADGCKITLGDGTEIQYNSCELLDEETDVAIERKATRISKYMRIAPGAKWYVRTTKILKKLVVNRIKVKKTNRRYYSTMITESKDDASEIMPVFYNGADESSADKLALTNLPPMSVLPMPVELIPERSTAVNGQRIITGLILDCLNSPAERTPAPVIYDEDGRIIYSRSNVTFDVLAVSGLCDYVDQNSTDYTRAGNAPLIIRPLALRDFNRNFVVSRADGARILAADAESGMLADAAMVVLINN
ncbi:MAG: hypothetical protein WCV63_07670 [Negativicutes bacterium]